MGTPGEPGENGDPGKKGDPGEKGDQGDQGDQGETGPSGVITVLTISDFDFGDDLATTDTVTDTMEFPAGCQTASYVAGPSEVAVMNVSVSLSPLGTSSESEFLGTATFDDGDGFETAAGFGMYDTVFTGDNSAGSVATSRSVELTDGLTYLFGLGIKVSTGAPNIPGLNGNRARCTGTVMIVRQ